MNSIKEIGPRTGQNYIDTIRDDGRRVFIDGEEVNDVTNHSAFREAVKTIAKLYDISSASSNRNLMRFQLEGATESINRIKSFRKPDC